ncbi:MAG: diguanylate cyclase [Bdellovibrionales bacterium]
MSLQIPRAQYGIYLLDGREDRAQPTLELLREAGYQPQLFTTVEPLREALQSRPPHVILFHRSDEQNKVGEALKEFRQRLPESHFLILSSAAGLAATWREWGNLIYDCVMAPPVHPRQMIRAIERAAERDAYLYRNEELNERLAAAEALLEAPAELEPAKPVTIQDSIENLREETQAFLSSVMEEVSETKIPQKNAPFADLVPPIPEFGLNFDFGATWSRLIKARQLEDLVHETVSALGEQCPDIPVIFLRHLPNRRCLVASVSHGLSVDAAKNLGLNLSEEPGFCLSDLRHPEKLMGLKEMARSLVRRDEVWVRPLELRDEIYGLFVVFASLADVPVQRLEAIVQVGNERGRLLDMQQYLHTIEIHDPATAVLNRATMEERLRGEIARSRRLQSPVSLLTISLDQYRDLLTHYGLEEAQMAVRALAKIIQPRSRANDILGRLTAEELGLILPHTACEGATIKAERLRKLIASADFNRLIPRFPKLTVSIGVSEYPSCCRDVDDLFSTADDALWQVKNKVNNKVCVSTPVAGFVPDFQVLSP